ncbi:MAG TPA: hypothetical protein VKB86_11310 [Pyrinomonadaceae bacterium]|nr:hypothetical protein [Pyrinomonadaceae bacterium]
MTKPTIETVLNEMRDGFARIERKLDDFEKGLSDFAEWRKDFDVRLDRVESVVNQTRSEMLTLRADFKELKSALIEHIPALKS